MKSKTLEKVSSSLLTLALLLTSSINSLTVYAEESNDGKQKVEEKTNMEEVTLSQEITEEETEKDTSMGVVSPVASNILKGSPVRATKNAGAFNVTGGTAFTDWVYNDATKILTFNKSGTYTVTGDGVETSQRIIVQNGFSGTITLSDVNINVNIENKIRIPAMDLNSGSVVTLVLQNNNYLSSNRGAGLAVTGGAKITIKGNGYLKAQSFSYGPGIGAGFENESCGNITIESGTIDAIGGGGGAGIGTRSAGDIEGIEIRGGIVTAIGGDNAAGIGGGKECSGNNIRITGGVVTAEGKNGASGIGSGAGNNTANVIITGGSIDANGVDAPKNNDGNPVYLLKVNVNGGVNKVVVDDTEEFIREQSLPSDTSFYLYLTGEEHTLKYTEDNKEFVRIAKWNEYDKTFNIIKQTATTPDLEIEKLTGTSITVKALANTDEYGKAQYSLDNSNWQDSNEFTELEGKKEYVVYAKYFGNHNYNESSPKQITVKTLESDVQKLARAKPLAEKVIKEYNATNTNTKERLLQAVNSGIVSIDGVSATWIVDPTITKATIDRDGSIVGIITLKSGNKTIDVNVELVFKFTDKDRVELVQSISEKVIKEFKATNTTTKEDVIKAVRDSLSSVAGVSTTWKTDPTITKATWLKQGTMNGILVLQYKQETIEIIFDKVIEKINPIIYRIIDDKDVKWELGSKEGITFKVDVELSKFIGIQVNGKTIDESFYTTKSGSTIITLKPEYLNALKAGSYEVSTLFDEGYSKVQFTVKETSKPIVPDENNNGTGTGDTTNTNMYVFMSMISLAIIGMFYKKRKHAK